jgi:hypothetical protein
MKQLQILLPIACPQRWDKMQASQDGRFCHQCEKHVVDMTTKTDEELIAFFESKSTHTCGRFLETQLNRTISATPKPSNWQWLVPFVMSVAVFSPSNASALKLVTQYQSVSSANTDLIRTNHTQLDTIRIKVVDQNNMPLPDVSVMLLGEDQALATTNISGQLQLNLNEAKRLQRYLFAVSGYQTKTTSLHNGMVLKMFKESQTEPQIRLGGFHGTTDRDRMPIYVFAVHNKRYILNSADFSSRKINPDWIETINIIKDAKTGAEYGAKRTQGVILIKVKEKFAKKVKRIGLTELK